MANSSDRLDFVGRVGKNVARARRDKKLTQEQVATLAALDPRNYQRIEAGAQNITLETLARIAIALQVDPSELTLPRTPRARTRVQVPANNSIRFRIGERVRWSFAGKLGDTGVVVEVDHGEPAKSPARSGVHVRWDKSGEITEADVRKLVPL